MVFNDVYAVVALLRLLRCDELIVLLFLFVYATEFMMFLYGVARFSYRTYYELH